MLKNLINDVYGGVTQFYIAIGFKIFALLFLVFSAYWSYQVIISQGWNSTTSLVLEDSIQKVSNKGARRNMLYSYQIEGKKYKGNQLAFTAKNLVSFSGVPSWSLQGKKITIYYDKIDPNRSVVSNQMQPLTWALLFNSLGWIAFSFLSEIYYLLKSRKVANESLHRTIN